MEYIAQRQNDSRIFDSQFSKAYWNISETKSYDDLLSPTSAHFNSFCPSSELLCAFLCRYLGFEDCHAGCIDILKLIKVFPHTNSKPCCDSCPERSRFQHFRALNRDANEICLRLRDVRLSKQKYHSRLTCIQRSEFVIPPSTASSARACPLSFCIASRIALV